MAYLVCTTSADPRWSERNAGEREVQVMLVETERDAQGLCDRLNMPAVSRERTYPFYYRPERSMAVAS